MPNHRVLLAFAQGRTRLDRFNSHWQSLQAILGWRRAPAPVRTKV
jgi:hypothetical protein